MAAILLALSLAVGACSADEGTPTSDDKGTSAGSDGSSEPPITTRATLGRITGGKLSAKDRQRLKKSVTGVVDGWLDAAYVGGDYPRGDFHDAFPGFTRGARADAHGDRALMSNQDIGRKIDGVTATRRQVRVDALVVRRHPVGVTARFRLAFRTSGDLERRYGVQGRLFLTRDQGWRVFGYEVTRDTLRTHGKGDSKHKHSHQHSHRGKHEHKGDGR